MDYFVRFFRESRDVVEEAKARAMATEGKITYLEEALKATKAKVAEDLSKANRKIKSLKAKLKVAEREVFKVRA